jgi:hypothetical protein
MAVNVATENDAMKELQQVFGNSLGMRRAHEVSCIRRRERKRQAGEALS